MKTSEFFAVIMAGGGGTRLWPLSRRERPKQTLRLSGDRSLFQLAIDRLLPIVPPERILVATVAEQAELLRDQAPDLSRDNFLLEPGQRGTASVIGLAATVLRQRSPDSTMACLTADHFIGDVGKFQALLLAAREVADRGFLVTLGITPTYPSTGYGYIERAEPLEPARGTAVFRMAAFREKPSQEIAQGYIQSGKYSWNSGMFIWKTDRILDEIKHQMPALAAGLRRIEAARGDPEEVRVIEDVWRELKPQTLDYGIMEHAERAAVIPADDLGWCDIGSWERLFEALPLTSDGNLVLAEQSLRQDIQRSLIYQDSAGGRKRLIAALGLKDVIIVDTQDVLLVCSKERSEDVRKLVERLTDAGLDEYL
jgi:mannose-1-phosphate guanylyltransferase